MTATLTVHVLGAVDEITEADWRAVTRGRGFYSSPRWLRLVEDDPWHDVWYLAVRDEARLLGVLPVYLATGPRQAAVDAFYDPAAVFVEPSGAGDPARWRPALVAGGRAGYETELLLRPGLPAATRREVLAAIVARLRRLAKVWGVDATAFMYLTPDAARELGPVLGARPLLATASASVPLAGCDTFDDYLGRLGGHRRRRVRHEIQEFARGGLTIREARLSDTVGVLAPLLAEHHGRYGLAEDGAMLAAHLGRHAEHLDDLARVLLCQDGGRTVGALLAYEWEDGWYARAVGLADGLRGAYFNLVYYEPIRLAVQRGAARYAVGPSTIGAKVKRGAVLEPRWSLLDGTDRVAADISRLSAGWNDQQLKEWDEQLRQIGHEAGTETWSATDEQASSPRR
jgi:hypothetical protein